MGKKKSWRNRFRIRLRTVFVLFTISCVTLGWFLLSVNRQRVAYRFLTEHGALVKYDPKSDFIRDNHDLFLREEGSWKCWLAETLGIDFFANVDSMFMEAVNERKLHAIGDLRGLTDIELSLDGVRSLSPLAKLRRLKYLHCRCSDQLEEIDAASNWHDLTQVSLSNAYSLRSIDGLRGLRHLERVFIETARISDISALNSARRLKELCLRNTQVADLSPIVAPELKYLSVSNSGVQELKALRVSTKLEELCIRNTQVRDLSPISGLRSLWLLDAENCPIEDVTPLQELTKLGVLNLSGCRIKDLSALQRLKALNELRIGVDGTVDLSPLRSLKSLDSLLIQHHPSPDLSHVANHALTDLRLYDCGKVDLSVFVGTSNLRALRIENTKVSGVEVLSKMPALEFIQLHNVQLDSLSFLNSSVLQVRSLDISDNPLRSLDGIQAQAKLERLNASQTDIQDLSRLSKLISLEALAINDTPVRDLGAISKLSLNELLASRSRVQNLRSVPRSVEILDVSASEVVDINGVQSLANLFCLDLSRTLVKDVELLLSTKRFAGSLGLILHGTDLEPEKIAQLKRRLRDVSLADESKTLDAGWIELRSWGF